jgi:glyoxylase-like metal-dependent hydrolase (beta-lactamase superfamily II)
VSCPPTIPFIALFLFELQLIDMQTQQWSSEATDLFPRTCYSESHHLPEAIKTAGYNIKDVKAVIMGHLHLDHAGGLEHFRNSGVPIYVHEEEFKHACWAAGTNSDGGVYM